MPPMLISVWIADPRDDADGEQRAEVIARAHDDAEPAHQQDGEEDDDDRAADEPELLADDREDAVRVGAGHVEELLPAGAEPQPVDAAAASAISSCSVWKPRPLGSSSALTKAKMRSARYWPLKISSDRDERRDAGEREDVRHRSAGDEHERHRRQDDHDGRAEVRLQHHRPATMPTKITDGTKPVQKFFTSSPRPASHAET